MYLRVIGVTGGSQPQHPVPLPTKLRVVLALRLFRFTTSGVNAQLVRVGRTEYDPEASPPKLYAPVLVVCCDVEAEPARSPSRCRARCPTKWSPARR